MKKLLCILAAIFCSSLILISFHPQKEAYAKSVVTIGADSCTIDIKVYVAFYGKGAWQALIDEWTADVRRVFNAKKYKSGECKCPVEINVIAILIKDPRKCPRGFHCVEVKPRNQTSFVTFHEPLWLWWNKWQGLGSEKESPSRTGEFSMFDDGAIVTHELGHFLGLDDEYVYVYDKDGNIIEVRCNPPTPKGEAPSIMCSTARNAAFKQRHIDDITGWISCPGRCCCGNEILETKKGEECDPPNLSRLMGSQCGSYTKYCTKKCKWTGSPPTCCGDGIIQKPNSSGQTEQCESNTDCNGSKICCPETCQCVDKQKQSG